MKEVMENANDPALEITLKEARKINKDVNIGDFVGVEIVPRDLVELMHKLRNKLLFKN